MTKVPWTSDDIVTNALKWRSDVAAGLSWRDDKRHYMEVQYEEFVARPAPVLREICQFVGEEYDEQMLDFHKHTERYVTEQPWKNEASKPLNTQPLEKWKVELSSVQVGVVEIFAGRIMELCGYRKSAKTAWDRIRYPLTIGVELKKYVSYKRRQNLYRRREGRDVVFGERGKLLRTLLRTLLRARP
jgi:hypothetical protein